MTVDDIIKSMRPSDSDVDRGMEITQRIAEILDEYEASSLDAMRAVSFVLGSAVDSLAVDLDITLEQSLTAAVVMVDASARLHAKDNASTEVMTAN